MKSNPVPGILTVLVLTAMPLQAQTLARSYTGCCQFGWAVADSPDLDGDGHRDFLGGHLGRMTAYATGKPESLWTYELAGTDFSYSLSSVPDTNGDGIADAVGGAPSAANGGTVRLLSGANGSERLAITAPAGRTRFGAAVSGIRDINGDGRGDFLVGAPGGNTDSITAHSGLDGAVLFSVTAPNPGGEFGAGVARVRDLDADDVDEFIVGAPGINRAYVYSGASRSLMFTLAANGFGRFGEFFVADAGDVNRDGIHDLYVGAYGESNGAGAAYVFSGKDGVRLYRFAGAAGEGLGPGRSAGDVNGDGHADLIVGGYTWSGGGLAQAGRVTIFSGANGQVLTRVNGTRIGGQAGFDTVGVGDVNADGRLDFIVASAPAGAVDLYHGAIESQRERSIIHGLEGTWSDPAFGVQGLIFEVVPTQSRIAGGWFTHASISPESSTAQRWFTVVGPYQGHRTELAVVQTVGSQFEGGAVQFKTVGSVDLDFIDCATATAHYRVHRNALTGEGDPTIGPIQSGVQQLKRVTTAEQCSDTVPE